MKVFPRFRKMTPGGIEERKLRGIPSIKEQKFYREHPDLIPVISLISTKERDQAISVLGSYFNKTKASSQDNQKYNQRIIEIEEENKQRVRESDARLAEVLRINNLTFLSKNIEDWNAADVCLWVKSKCPDYEPVTFKTNFISGKDLLEMDANFLELLQVPMGPRASILRELSKIKGTAQGQPIAPSYYTSNYKYIISNTSPVEFQDEVFFRLRSFIDFYCETKNIPRQNGLDFFHSLQEEALGKQKDYGEASSICARLWTSAKTLDVTEHNSSLSNLSSSKPSLSSANCGIIPSKIELCNILCEVLREDDQKALKMAAILIKGMSHITNKARETIQWPEDNLLFRGGGIPKSKREQFTEGKKYRCPVLLATSRKRKIGEMLCYRAVNRKIDAILYIIHLDKGKCFNVNYIGRNSNIDNEEEFLFLPYSVFTVRSTLWQNEPSTGNPHIIHLNASADSESESEFLPIVNWH